LLVSPAIKLVVLQTIEALFGAPKAFGPQFYTVKLL